MDKGKLIGGIICLAIAGLLVVLNLTLSADSMMFMVGDENMPWVPPIILGIIGIVLLSTAGIGGKEAAQKEEPEIVMDPEKAAINKRLETIGWGCFLIMLGGLMFVPDQLVPNEGIWSIGVGLILLGLNAARYFYGIKMSGFTTFLGIISLLDGILQLIGVYDLGGAVLFIVLGAYLIVKPWFEKQQLFGKAEEA